MSAAPVTELIVRGDGALDVLDRFETGMEKAGIATEHSTGAIADFERRMATARAAIERGNAVTTESIARKSAEQRAWEKWSSTVDKSHALRIRLEREAAQASVAAANAVNLGYTTQEQALATLIALEARHAAQLSGVTTQHQSAAQAVRSHAAANDNLARSNAKLAANDNSFQTANVAAQFQDIGVTAAMGMNPIMIALQQGTQLSAILNTMQNPLRGLATAFMSIINPVSLLTIGFIALGAAAIQWFMSAANGAEAAEEALARHDEWLDKILEGYGDVRDAAKRAGEEARKLPQAEVDLALAGDLAVKQNEYAAALARVQVQVLATNASQQTLHTLWLEGGDAALKQREALLGVQDAAMKANPDLDTIIFSLKSFIQNNPESVLLNIAQGMLDNAAAARTAEGALNKMAVTTLATKTYQDQLAASARESASGILQSANAAWQAVQGYSAAAGAAVTYTNAMRELGGMVPEVAAAQAQLQRLDGAQAAYNSAMSANRTLLAENAITQTEFAKRQGEAADLYQRARNEITGLTDATRALSEAERSAAIGAMAPREAALERIRDKYADIDKALRDAGAGPEEFARSVSAMNQEIETSNASFDKLAAGASGAGRSVGGVADAYDRLIGRGREFIEQAQIEAEALLMTTSAASAYRYEQELLNQAANDNLALTAIQRDELAALASSMAEAEMAVAGVRFALGDPDPWQQAISNIDSVNAALATGSISWEQYGAAAFKANSGAASAVLGLASGMTSALSQMFQDNKGFAVANAVVSTAEAVMKAMATYGPTPWGFAAAGVAAATGAAQIATILSAQKGSSSVSRPSGSASSQSQTQAQAQRAVQLNVTLGGSGRYSRDEVRDLLEQLADGLNDGVDQGNFKIAVNS